MASLPDPNRSSAVLIGTSIYEPDLPGLPAVQNNLQDLAVLLTDPILGVLRADRCQTVLNPQTPSDVGRALSSTAEMAEDLLVVYYAGHGLLGFDGELYLGLSETKQASLAFTALPYNSIRDFLRSSVASKKVVILDCCYSGRSLGSMSSPGSAIADQAMISGTYVIASSSPSAVALVRPGDPYTAFTGELIRILKEGISGGPPLLTLSDVYTELRRTLTALGYPQPQRRFSGDADDIFLARNAATLSEAETPQLSAHHVYSASSDGVSQPQAPEDGSQPEPEDDTDVEWAADEPAREDLLQRGFLADVIAMRLVETQENWSDTSFCVHIDGPWGSGKSTLMNLVEARVGSHFRIVRFDAWQQSRLSPSWWSLLTALRREIVRGQHFWIRPVLRVKETWTRIRRAGAPYIFATALIMVAALAVGYWLWPRTGTLTAWSQNIGSIIALIAAVGTLSTGALVAARFLLWDSARGARLFEQNRANPMGDVAAHFRWLLMHADKPVAFFIDDLDRCPESHVVEFLDTIQTLIRGGSVRSAAGHAVHFVLAADGAWLRRSYEGTYSSFADCVGEPGRPLGYLFLDKFFQLSVPMPALAGQAQRRYLDHMLHIDSLAQAPSSDIPANHASPSTLLEKEDAIHNRLRLFAVGRSRKAVESLTAPAAQVAVDHSLRKFASLLGHNPRSIKKFINTFSILRSVRTLEGNFIDSDSLALWAIILVRWPELGDYLQKFPEAVAGIIDPLWCSDHFVPPLQQLVGSEEVCAVVKHSYGGPLTPGMIRQCCGMVGTSGR
jgi:KAP family P-loop domain/Caspase domain